MTSLQVSTSKEGIVLLLRRCKRQAKLAKATQGVRVAAMHVTCLHAEDCSCTYLYREPGKMQKHTNVCLMYAVCGLDTWNVPIWSPHGTHVEITCDVPTCRRFNGHAG